MSDPVGGVRAGYDRWAAVYDHDANPLQALEGPIVRDRLGDVAGLEALDLGCGTGRHASWLAEQGAVVTAVDFSEGMLNEARRKAGAARIAFLTHDLHAPLPFPDGTFDVIVSGLVLEHLRELDKFFGEAQRVLRPTGRAVISAMHPAMFLRGTMANFRDPDSGDKIRPGSVPHSVSDFVTAALQADFNIQRISEHAPDAEQAQRVPRAAKYVGWPMLVVMELNK